jgi:lipopolysaccharide transport system ATP-binding protein
MSRFAIRCRDLGKRYRVLTANRAPYSTLRESVTNMAATTLRRLRGARFRQADRSRQAKDMFWALQAIDFEAHHGEVIGVIGRNGAGKSTLLKILSRITEPTVGYAEIEGRVGSMLEVGTGFHPELTGRENVYLNGAILGMNKVEVDRKFDEIVDFSGVEPFIDTPVKHYSSGMQLRLAFAVSAQLQTEVLFVDEVLAVGDSEFQKKCLGTMENVGHSGRTVLFVSHSMPAIQRLCTRGIFLDRGRIAHDGGVTEAIERYLQYNAVSEYIVERIPDAPCITRARAGWTESDGIDLEVEFRSPFKLLAPVLGFVLYDPAGTPVFGTNNQIERSPVRAPAVASGTIRIRIDTDALRSNTYGISLWLGDGREDYCHLEHALRVEIGAGESPHHPSFSSIGSTRLATAWSFQPHEHPRGAAV